MTKIDGLVTEDRALATLLAASDEAEWPAVVERALAVGVARVDDDGAGCRPRHRARRGPTGG